MEAKTPKIRFKGFTDPWEQRKLGDIAKRVTRKNEERESDLPLTISAQYGLVDQREYFNNQVASKDMSGYYLLRRGEFAYNKSTSSDSPWGAIKQLVKYDKGCVSTLYICFDLIDGDPDYLTTYYETNRWYKGIQEVAAEGARNHGLLNIAPDDFFDTTLTLPAKIEEQQAIGTFFSQLDNLITLHQRKYDKLCCVKKSMLEKMFPKPGETEPEIRFEGFTDPWEQRKLGEVADIKTGPFGSLLHAGDYVDDGIPIVTTEHFKNGLLPNSKSGLPQVSESDRARLDQYSAQIGDILFSRVGSVDINAPITPAQDGWLFSGRVLRARPDGNYIVTDYLHFELSTDRVKKSILERAVGGTMASINTEILRDTYVNIPASIKEQRQIGAFFTELNNLITLHQRKLNSLKNIKKSLLEKMFV